MTRMSHMRIFSMTGILKFIFVFLGFYLLGKIGLLFATVNNNATPIWPPTGFALFAMIVLGVRYWPAIFFASALVTFQVPTSWHASLGVGLGNTLEAVVGHAIFFAVLKNRALFSYQSKSLAIIGASFLSPLVSASLGVLSLFLFGAIGADLAFTAWMTWYGGNLVGGLLLLPVLLEVRSRWRTGRWGNEKGVFAVLLSALIFIATLSLSTYTVSLLVALPLCLATLLYAGTFATFVLVLVISVLCALAAWIGTGPFVQGDTNINLLYHILFLCGLSVTVLTLAAFKKAQVLKENVRILLFAWMVSSLLIAGLELFSKNRDEVRLLSLVANAKSMLEARMFSYERALQGGVAFIQASRDVTRKEWRHFAAGFDLVASLPGVLGYGYIESVKRDSLPSFLRDVRRDGAPDFAIKNVPSADLMSPARDDLFVVKFVEPEMRNRSALGLDIGSQTLRRATAVLARTSGKPAMSSSISLVQDPLRRPGFVLLVPVYKVAGYPSSLEERLQSHMGWTYAPFVTSEFFESALGHLLIELNIEVYEDAGPLGSRLVYSSKPRQKKLLKANESAITEVIELAQHRFTVVFHPAAGFAYSRDRMTAWAGALSMLLGLLIISALVNLQISNRRIRQQVQAKALELSRAQELAESHRMKSIEAARLASLGEMAGGIAHEINNPLAIIMTRTDQFKRRVESGELTGIDLQLFLDRIDSTAKRIAKIVKGMKNLARDGTVAEYQVTTLEQIVEDALDVCREKFKSRGIHLEVEILAKDVIECQAVQISQVLVNLLNNSEHALEGTANPWIRLRAKIEKGFVNIEVVDSGRGIPAFIAARMMEPFFTTKEVGKGTGLGLSIARNIMEEHDGSLEYRSDRANTTFSLKFPARRAL